MELGAHQKKDVPEKDVKKKRMLKKNIKRC